MTRAALALLLSGCAGIGVPLTASQSRTVDIVREEWRAGGLEWRDGCARQQVMYLEADNATMMRETSWCAAESPICVESRSTPDHRLTRGLAGCLYGVCSAGSVLYKPSEIWPVSLFAPWRIVIVVSAYLSDEVKRAALVHEYTHVLSECATGDSDDQHRTAAVWSSAGVVGRATARAREQ